jgi:preprotein translocase subunit SecA
MDSVIGSQWRMLSRPLTCDPPPRGLDRLWLRAAGRVERLWRGPGRFMRDAESIVAREKTYQHLPDGRLEEQLSRLRNRFLRGRDTDADRHHGLAILREVADRTVGLRPYREQIAAALALHAGCVVEMATGEGKTLAAALAAVLAGWRGRGCHVITANDYLAGRDAGSMNAIYRFCGLTVGCIATGMEPMARKKAYHAHVTYCTNKEVAADFLRDRLIIAGVRGLPALLVSRMSGAGDDRIDRLVQRGLETAIVDEADAVFIDDASTPLLISGDGPNPVQIEAYEQAAQLAAKLDPADDYRVFRNSSTVRLTPAGKRRLAELAGPLGRLWSGARRREELVRQALVADTLFARDKHYVIDSGKVVIVDPFTGRLMPDRSWRDGLHQAMEAKEGVAVNLPKETHARISYQRFFRLYRRLSGMSGTLAESRTELWDTYGLPVIPISTHRPCRRTVQPDRIFTTAAAKWDAVIAEIDNLHRTGRPLLIGTGSIRESRQLSDRLSLNGMAHCLLNGVQHASEAQIIADAGQKGQITVSTNLAGRGTDIRLGPGVARQGGLHVIATERSHARRIDRQLAGRCARQGDPGSVQAFVSLEDELVRPDNRTTAAVMRRLSRCGGKELSHAFWRRWIAAAQRGAERASFLVRRDVLAADDWLERQLGFAAKDL